MSTETDDQERVLPKTLRALRKEKGLTLQQLAERVDVSPQQIQRLERGQRRITVGMLERLCSAMDADIFSLICANKRVPLLGVLDSGGNVKPLPPNSEVTAPAPYLGVNPDRLAALRWEPTEPIGLMFGHRIYFRRDIDGIDPKAWDHRAIIRLADDTQRIGWLMEEHGQVHVVDVHGTARFNVDAVWASKVLAVTPPDEEW